MAGDFVPNRLIESLAEICRQRLLAEKWLLVPSMRVGHQWLQCVARTGQPAVNVRTKTLRSLAIDLVGPLLAQRGVSLLNPLAGTVIVQQLLATGKVRLTYFEQNTSAWSTAELLYRTLDDLRMAGVQPTALRGHIDPPTKAEDLCHLYEAYLAAIDRARRIDLARLLELAQGCLTDGTAPLASDMLLLIPADLELPELARRFIEAFPTQVRHVLYIDELPAANPGTHLGPVSADRELLCWIDQPQPLPPPARDGTLRIVRAVGEVNEVRQVFRWCLARQVPLDQVEILYTDAQTYVPLIYEELAARYGTMEVDALPASFADGLPCRFSRPGRLLRLWLQWVQEGFPQRYLELMIQDALLKVRWPAEVPEEQHSHSRLARRLALLNVGLGHDRYLRILDEYLASLQTYSPPMDEDAPVFDAQELTMARTEALVLRELAAGLLGLVSHHAQGKALLEAADRLLADHARCFSQLDEFAVNRLRQEIQQLLELLGDGGAHFNAPSYLEQLLESTVQGSGPRPGAVHVASLKSGGHTGRPYTWVLGLDDSRFPGAILQDPLLLDGERRRVSTRLNTSHNFLEENLRRFTTLGARVRGTLTLSYSTLALADNRQLFPSPVVLGAFRLLAERPDGDLAELEQWLSEPPAAFVPQNETECLSAAEWWQWRLLTGGGTLQEVQTAFPHLARGQQAAAARSSPDFTEFDGNVPAAGRVLDLTARDRAVSATELQTVGRCPLRFFFRYGLHLRPPDEFELDAERWLDALSAGDLLHRLFEQFMREIIESNRLPDVASDRPRLMEILDQLIQAERQKRPPASEAAFRRRVQELRETAVHFLLEECHYIQTRGARPMWTEAALGLRTVRAGSLDTPEPLTIELANGGRLRVCARIDRIDRLESAGSIAPCGRHQAPAVHTYCIWDYKTGSTSTYNRAEPFQQGRNIQPYLYLTVVAHRLRDHLGSDVRVESFGYFFPSTPSAGERMQWSADQLGEGRQIVMHLCQVVSQGAFVATDCQQDCALCDYQAICGDVSALTAASRRKLQRCADRRLDAMRSLRPPPADDNEGP